MENEVKDGYCSHCSKDGDINDMKAITESMFHGQVDVQYVCKTHIP